MDEPRSGLIKRPASGRFGGYTYLAKGRVPQLIADDILFEADVAGSYTLTVSPATVAITGQTVALRAARSLIVTQATIPIVGQVVTLRRGQQLTVTPTTVVLTGQTVGLRSARRLTVTPASVPVVGQSVGLRSGRSLTVTPAAVPIVGQSVSLRVSRSLTVSPGTVALVGQSVALNLTAAGAVLTVTPGGVVEIVGQSVGLTYAPVIGGPTVPIVPIASGGWRGGGERGTTAIYGPLRQQKRKLKRLIDEAEDENASVKVIAAAKAAHTREDIARALVAIEAELQRIADDEDDEDWMMLAA